MSSTQHKAQCMVDTSKEFFEIRVSQCDSKDTLRKFTELETEQDPRTDRIATANKRLVELKDE
jgi:hypothetical protein